MADAPIHLNQAKHNQIVAKKLANIKALDWAITTAFYSAMHFLEASFIKDSKYGHTEQKYSSLQLNESDLIRDKSLHAFREMLVGNKYPKDNLKSKLAQLRTMSEACRYLERTSGKTGYSYISDQDVGRGLKNLEEIKKATSRV